MSKKALIAGATGLIGGHLLEKLLADNTYAEVIAIVRKPLDIQHPKLNQRVVDFDQLSENGGDLYGVDDVFCCLGTTIKKVKTQEAFKHVDYDYPLEIAVQAKKHGASRYYLVSAIGADPNSRFFYMRTKGQLEQALGGIGYDELAIFRPSQLYGDRKEFRFGEKVSEFIIRPLSFLFLGSLRKYRIIAAATVASAMLRSAHTSTPGTSIYPSNEIEAIGGKH